MTKQRLTITVEGDLSPERVDEALRSVAEIYERPVSTRGGWGHIPGVGYKWTVEPVEPVERTPEVVLRAMLRAYTDAGLAAEAGYFAADDSTAEEADAASRMTMIDGGIDIVRERLARLLSRPDDLNDMGMVITADYEARLRGDRPLDAPPMEVP